MADEYHELIKQFYTAFQRLDAPAMLACCCEDVVFCDPAFGRLQGAEVRAMWQLLCQRASGFSLDFDQVYSHGDQGGAQWQAQYRFGPAQRPVLNRVTARFTFRDGRIATHEDRFDLWRWARQALGLKGWLLGWTPMLRRAVQAQARQNLQAFIGD